jgi:epoxyqueuosine reductase
MVESRRAVQAAGDEIGLAESIREEAQRLGFDFCRIVPVEQAAHADFFERWLAVGRAGEMRYLERHAEKRRSPDMLAGDRVGFRSMIVLAVDYYLAGLPAEVVSDPSRGMIASYAWGDDYHEIVRPLLYQLDEFIRARTGRTTLGKGLVDTGPVLERDWAHRAGIGFTGKSCCTIHPDRGSWLFLATLLIPEIVAGDPPPPVVGQPAVTADDVLRGLPAAGQYGQWSIPLWDISKPDASRMGTCGACTRCLDACPTDAFVGPFHLDPQRCISYWTIEAKGPIPRELRPHFGNRIFGCDICQEVCPWNRRLPPRTPLLAGLHAHRGRIAPSLLDGFRAETPYWLDGDSFAAHFRRSPVRRAKRQGMLRNVCVALGNWGGLAAIPALRQALSDSHPLPRGHAAWALGEVARRHAAVDVRPILADRLGLEPEEWVRDEIRAALHVLDAR